MTREEYAAFLAAVGARHIRIHRVHRWCRPEGIGHLRYQIDSLAKTARFARVVADRNHKTELYAPLGEEVGYTYITDHLSAFDEAGVSEALDEHAEIIFPNLSRDVVPDVDLLFLREAGVEEPEAELTIIIEHARLLGRSHDLRPSSLLTGC